MAYASSSDVAALVKNLVSGASDFSINTSPTLIQVQVWLSAGCSLINAMIGTRNYGVIPENSLAYNNALALNAIYAAYKAELSRTNAREAPGTRTRAEELKSAFDDSLLRLKTTDLSKLGVALAMQSGVYSGGRSSSDKQSVEGDSDRVQPRFERGEFANPAAQTSSTDSGAPLPDLIRVILLQSGDYLFLIKNSFMRLES